MRISNHNKITTKRGWAITAETNNKQSAHPMRSLIWKHYHLKLRWFNSGEELKVITRHFTKLWIPIQKCTRSSACWKTLKHYQKLCVTSQSSTDVERWKINQCGLYHKLEMRKPKFEQFLLSHAFQENCEFLHRYKIYINCRFTTKILSIHTGMRGSVWKLKDEETKSQKLVSVNRLLLKKNYWKLYLSTASS